MFIDDLLLKKEEIPVWHRVEFKIPIHPSLIKKRLDPNIPNAVLEQSVMEWYEDLKTYLNGQNEEINLDSTRKLYLSEKPKPVFRNGEFIVYPWHIPIHFWTNENGFADSLSVGRNFGSLNFEAENSESEYPLISNSKYMQFSESKLQAYAIPDKNPLRCFRYLPHNIETAPAALLLRNWTINYLNAALKS